MHAAKNVMCHVKMKHTAKPLYMQKILMDGNEFVTPITKEAMSVNDVIVIETAASDNIRPMRSGKSILAVVRRHAANITNVSSIPTAVQRQKKAKCYQSVVYHGVLSVLHTDH